MDQFIFNIYTSYIKNNEPEFMILFNAIYEKALEMKLYGAVITNWNLVIEGKLKSDDPECDPDIDIDKAFQFEFDNKNIPVLKDGKLQVIDRWKSDYFKFALQIYSVMKQAKYKWSCDYDEGFNWLPDSFLNELFKSMGYPNIICTEEEFKTKFIYDSNFVTDEMKEKYFGSHPECVEALHRMERYCTPVRSHGKYKSHSIRVKSPIFGEIYSFSQTIYEDTFDEKAKQHLKDTINHNKDVFKNFGTVEVWGFVSKD